MLSLGDLQAQFSQALTASTFNAAPQGINQHYDEEEKQARFLIYRNNVFASLIAVLSGVYPLLKKVVGDDYFRQLSADFVVAHPPSAGALVNYGEDLPGFITASAVAQSLPYLADLAKCEWLHHQAYYAADAQSLTAGDFAAVDQTVLASATLRFQPSAVLFSSHYAIHSLIDYLHNDESDTAEFDIGKPEQMLVVRPKWQVHRLPLNEGNFCFLQALMEGSNITQALTHALEQHPSLEPAAAFAQLIHTESVTEIIGDPAPCN